MGAASIDDPIPAPVNTALQTLYTDDVIALTSDPSMIGVVTRTAWDSDNEADDDWQDAESEDHAANRPTHHPSNDDEDGHDESDEDGYEDDESVDDGESDDGHLAPGYIRVLWLPPSYRTGHQSEEREFSLLNELPAQSCTLLDRSLLHGDVVSRASDLQSIAPAQAQSQNFTVELGTIVDVEVDLTLRMNDGTLRQISSRDVCHLHPFALGVHVFMRDQPNTQSKNQFGSVEQCLVDVTVKFPDGSMCVIPSATSGRLHDAGDMCVPFETQDASDVAITYFPGQTVHATFHTWQAAHWIVGTKQSAVDSELYGKIIAINPSELVVEWLSGMDALAPPAASPDQLAVLSEFEYSKFIVGDWVFIKELKADIDRDAHIQPIQQNRRRPRFERPLITTDYSTACGFIIGTRTRACVEWQSGQRTDWMDSRALLPRPSVMDTEFFVSDFVLVRGSLRLAYVLSVDAVQRMARVKFLDVMADEIERGSHELPEAGAVEREVGEIAEVPIFDLRCHPNLETASVSSMVVRIPGAAESWDVASAMTRPSLGQAGQIIAVNEGDITVRWADEEMLVSTVRVDNIYCLDAAEEEAGEGDEQASDYDEEEEDSENEQLDDEESAEQPIEPLAGSAPSFLSGVLNAAASVAHMLGQMTISHPAKDTSEASQASAIETANQSTTETSSQSIRETIDHSTSSETAISSENESKSELTNDTPNESPADPCSAFTFSSFRMIDSVPLHHHYHATQPINMSKSFIRRLNNEYSSWNSSLPRGIHIVGCESRMDLLSFAIVGPINTPYYQSVFCFDARLPQDYPISPPQIHYHSYQMRLHPNLYAEGKVCLSLLGTWTGSESQRWNDQSTLLQLFVSIQGLILGDSSPYYLEAGYSKFRSQPSSINQSILYNEQVCGFSIAHTTQQLAQIHNILHSESTSDHPFGRLVISHFAVPELVDQYNVLLQSINQSINQSDNQSEARQETLTLLKPFAIPPQNTDLPDHQQAYHLTAGFLHSLRGHLSKLVNKLAENQRVLQQQQESRSAD